MTTIETESWEPIHGRPAPPAPARGLRAGAVDALLDGVDLRYVRAGTVEAVRRVYVAVRDHNWNTIPGEASDLAVEERDGGFRVTFTCRHRAGDVDFTWEGSIVGEPDGTITYRMAGGADSSFDYNRIGFCILHPGRESLGAPYRGVTPDGPISGALPDLIEPQRYEDGIYVPLFPSVSELDVELPGGGQVRFAFEGALFETEDQRNWIDASHKTYGPPLSLGYPHRLEPGDRIEQGVRMSVAAPAAPAPAEPAGEVELAVGEPVRAGLPRIGLGAPTHDATPSERQIGLLRALAPDHLRADVRLAAGDHRAALRRVLDDCAAIGCGLELAIYLMEADADALAGVADELGGVRPDRVLVYAADAASPGPRETTPGSLVALVRARLGLPGVPVGGGTDMYFCELNRCRPEAEAMDVVAWSANPQVHAFDERSIMETPEALAETVRSARAFSGDRPLAVTPITLKPRFNANATRAEDGPVPGQLPTPVDPRQMSSFAAAWTLASLKGLLESDVASATYFEPIGWRGLIELEEGCSVPERFPSKPGMTFPVYHVLAGLAGRRDDEVLAVRTADDLRVAAFGLRSAAGVRFLVANLTAEPLQARLTGVSEGALSLALGPYAVESIDLPRTGAGA